MVARPILATVAVLALASAPRAVQSVKLNAPLAVASGDVIDLAVTPDGAAVVYLTARRTYAFEAAFAHELHAVPSDASVAPRLLFDSLTAWDEAEEDDEDVDLEPGFRISHDGRRVVFASTFDDNGSLIRRLHGVPLDGSAPATRLWERSPFLFDTPELEFELTSDDAWIVVQVDSPTQEGSIQSVRADGSGAVVLFEQDGGTVDALDGFELTPDGARVVYGTRGSSSTLFSVRPNGTNRLNLSGTLTGGRNITSFRLAPDGKQVVFAADLDVAGAFELYGVLVLDGPVTKLSATPVPVGGAPLAFQVSPDSKRVVYVADHRVNDTFELWSAALDGSGAIRLSEATIAGGDVQRDFRIAADSRTVVYRVDHAADELYELFAVPIDGSRAPLRLNATLVAGGDVSEGFLIGPGDKRVVYRADQQTDDVFELHSVPIDRSQAPLRLSGALVPGGDVRELAAGVQHFQIHAGRARVLYEADQDSDGVDELFSVPLDGARPPRKLSAPLARGGDVLDAGELPRRSSGVRLAGGGRVVYLADQERDELRELFVAPVDGRSPARKLSGPLDIGPRRGNVSAFRLDAASERVVYRADCDVEGTPELYAVELDGLSGFAKLNPPLAQGAGVGADFVLSPVGARAVFRAELEGFPVLFSAPVDGSQAPTALSKLLGPAASVPDFRSDPVHGRIVYRSSAPPEDVTRLYSSPIDGRLAPLELSGPLPASADVLPGFALSAGGAWAAFLADGTVNEKFELSSVPLAGRPFPVVLSPFFPGSVDVSSLALSPDETRAVFTASVSQQRLYVAPLEGRAAAVELSGPLVANGHVQLDYAIDPTSRRVVYRADQTTNEVFELFSAPLEGGQLPRRLNGPLVAGGDVLYLSPSETRSPFAISPDGARVVYVADQELDERYELFSVPIDASGPPVKLSGALIAVGDVGSPGLAPFRFAPDGAHLVYRADAAVDSRFELFRVPIDGSGAPLQLTGTSTPTVGMQEFEVAPDGSRVVYRAVSGGAMSLFSVPLAGGQLPLQHNGALVPGGSVRSFQLGSDGTLAYLADQDTLFVVELYRSTNF